MHSLILHEDEHLLVVNKPPGWNTHSPSPYAGEGVYDWLRHREPRWGRLAIIHRLDKATSGVLVFAKTAEACRSLTAQFTRREVRKEYHLATRAAVKFENLDVCINLRREGDRYVPTRAGGEAAKTRFEVSRREGRLTFLRAIPATGRTHQIRVHAATSGFPIVGDELYGGEPASRLWLHAALLRFRHPATDVAMEFQAPVDFEVDARRLLRAAVIDPAETDAFRILHGGSEAADDLPSRVDRASFHVDRFGGWLLSESPGDLNARQSELLHQLQSSERSRGAYHRPLRHDVRGKAGNKASPCLVVGEPALSPLAIRENGVRFEIRLDEGYSVGLFLDQRDNRRRLLANHVAAGFPLFQRPAAEAGVLNVFAYTCGFSVCAALAGARATSLDLSRKYLDWGRRNFELNELDPAGHDFIYGDAFDWLRRLAKKSRQFDVVLLDPPTFSTSKASGVFRAEKDYGRLVELATPLLRAGGILFASTNAAGLAPEDFLETVHGAVAARGRRVKLEHYTPQPPDFPISRDEPAYLKTVWLQLD